MTNTSAIKVENLKKTLYGEKIFNSLSFEVKKGEIFGLWGATGSGKTTVIKILTGLTKSDTGSFLFFGKHSLNRKKIGISFERHGFISILFCKRKFKNDFAD